MRFARPGVLQRQDGPVSGCPTVAQLVGLLTCLGQSDSFLVLVANQLDRVIIVVIQTRRAWITIPITQNCCRVVCGWRVGNCGVKEEELGKR